MSKLKDFSPLEVVEFIFVNHKHQSEPVYKNCFGNTLELQAVKALFINELLPALQKIHSGHDNHPSTFQPCTTHCLEHKDRQKVGFNTRSTATAMRDTIATGVMGHIEITIHIGTNVWKYPSTASSCLEDFELVEKNSGAANPTMATSALKATSATNILPFKNSNALFPPTSGLRKHIWKGFALSRNATRAFLPTVAYANPTTEQIPPLSINRPPVVP